MLVLLHPIGMDSRFRRRVVSRLAQHLRVMTIDLLNLQHLFCVMIVDGALTFSSSQD